MQQLSFECSTRSKCFRVQTKAKVHVTKRNSLEAFESSLIRHFRSFEEVFSAVGHTCSSRVWKLILQMSLLLLMPLSEMLIGDEEPRRIHEIEAHSFLSSTSREWRQSREKLTALTGDAEVHQTSFDSSIEIPAKLTAEDLDPSKNPAPTPIEPERREGSFIRIETAKVAFKVDIAQNKLWCQWTRNEPPRWIDSLDGSIAMTGRVTTASSIVTDSDFFHQESSSRVEVYPSGTTNVIAEQDVANQRGSKEYRGVLFRDPPERGHRLMERSNVFQPLHLLEFGGLSPDTFLERQAQSFKADKLANVKYPTEVRSMIGNLSGRTVFAFFHRGEDDPNPLVCETDWIPNLAKTSPAYLLSEMREYFSDKSHLPPYVQVNWTWDENHLKEGLVLPSSYDLVIRSEVDPDRVEFERNITVKSWEVNPALSEADFSIAALEPEIGDLIVDRETNTIAYFGRDKQPHDLPSGHDSSRPLPLGQPSKPGSFYLVMINAVVLVCGAIYMIWRRRKGIATGK